jgi:tRNA(Ile)-lysidine synthase
MYRKRVAFSHLIHYIFSMSNKKQVPALETRVSQYIRRYGLIPEGEKVLVAVSGGADSVCLLYILLKLQAELHFTLHIAHLNHQLRGEESDKDASFVADLARLLNLPATIEKRNVEAYQAEHRLSLEEAAREVRYGFLAETADRVKAGRAAVGHTLNDQVETILLHIIRGTGTWGLRGLQPYQDMQFSGNRIRVIRPLLEATREETEECCSREGVTPCLDISNLSFSQLRNRVRHELLPLLQDYNPGISRSLLRLSRIVQDDQAFLIQESSRAWDESTRRSGRNIIFDKQRFLKLAPALQRQLLRKAVNELLGTLRDIETRHIEEVMEALSKPSGRRIILPEGLVFSLEYDNYVLGFKPEELAPFPELKGEFDINIEGETEIPGWKISASLQEGGSYTEPECKPDSQEPGIFTACFDKDRVGDKIKVRTRLSGDWFQPLGLGQKKKVGEFMLDAKIPAYWRNRIPIVYTPQQIIWVAGWRIDERVKVTKQTREILCLRMVRQQDGKSGESRENS